MYTSPNTLAQMTSAGGVTLFAAASPNGAILARVPYFPPFIPDPDELNYTYGWTYFGVPPGTYYVAVILGVVATPNIAASDWTRGGRTRGMQRATGNRPRQPRGVRHRP